MFTGNSSKFLIALSGAISTALTTYYGNAHWLPPVLAGMGALLVYLVPNSGTAVALGRGTVIPPSPTTPLFPEKTKVT